MGFTGKPLVQPLGGISTVNYFADHGYRVRSSTRIEPLICGENAFNAISLALKLSQHSINMAFWGIDPGILLVKGTQSNYDPQNTLAEILLSKAAQGVKVKMVIWDHPFSFIGSGSDGGSKIIHQNNSRNLGTFRTAAQAAPNIEVKMTNAFSGLWAGGSFHQKLIVVDIEEPSRATAFVMGHNMMPNYWEQTSLSPRNSKRDYYLSMTAGGAGGNSFSYQAHPYVLPPMFDVSTQIWGGGITDVYHSFERIWTLNGGTTNPTHASLTQSEFVTQGRRGASQVAATFSRFSETSIRQQYFNAISKSNKYVFILDQYFRDKDLTDEIIAAYKIRRDAGRKIPPLIVISNDWETGVFMSLQAGHDTDLIKKFRDAKVPIIYCKMITKEAENRKDIYIHAKVLVVDDVFYTIGSANYNDRSMRSDPELNIGTVDPQGAERLRRDLWNICIGSPINEIMDDPEAGSDVWEEKLTQNALDVKSNVNLSNGRSVVFNPTGINIFPSKLAENTQNETATSYV